MTDVSKRYAQAVVELVVEQAGTASLDAVAQGLRDFQQAYNDSTELRYALTSPALREQRAGLVQAIAKRLGLLQPVQALLQMLVERGRLNILSTLNAHVQQEVDRHLNRVRVRVESAVALLPEQRERIAASFRQARGADVVLEELVTPELLGGFVCRVDDFMFDASVGAQLGVMAERFEQAA